jgi:hypothetical protein
MSSQSQCAVCVNELSSPDAVTCGTKACVAEVRRRATRKASRASQLERAKEKVVSLSKELGAEDALVRQIAEAEEKFERQANENAENVTLHRVNQFLDSLGQDLEEMVGRFCYTKGYTAFDAKSIIRKMRGAPRPIVIEPERPVLSFDDEDE